jgi:SEC10/PgrA surface exclusion-like protein
MKKRNIAASAAFATVVTGCAVNITANDVFAGEITETEMNSATTQLNDAKTENAAATDAVDKAQSELDAKTAEKEETEKIASEATPEKIAETETAINDKTAEKTENDTLVENAKNVEKTATDTETEKRVAAEEANKEKVAADSAVESKTNQVNAARTELDKATEDETQADVLKGNAKANLDEATATEKTKAEELETAKQTNTDLATAISNQETVVNAAEQAVTGKTATVTEKTTAADTAKTNLANAEKKQQEIEAKIGTAPEIKFADPAAVKSYIEGYNFNWYSNVGSAENRAYMDSASAKAARQDIINAFKNGKYVPTELDKTTEVDAWNMTNDQINELTLFGNSIINSMNKQFGYKLVKTNDPVAEATKWMQNEYKRRFVTGSEEYEFNHIGIEDDYTKNNDKFSLGYETLCAGSSRTGIGGNMYGSQLGEGKYAMADMKRAIFESIKAYMANGNELAHAQITTSKDMIDGQVGVWTIVPGSTTKMGVTVVQFNYAFDKHTSGAIATGSYVDNADKYADALANAKADVQRYTTEVADTAAAVEQAKTELETAKATLATEQEKLNSLKNGESPLALAQKSYDEAKAALDKAQQMYDDAVTAHAKATDAKITAEQKVTQATQALTDAEAARDTATQKATDAAAELQAATDARIAAQKDVADKAAKSKQLEDEIAELKKKLDIYKNAPEKLAEIEEEIKTLGKKLEDAKVAKAESDKKLATATENYDRVKADYDKQQAEAKAKEAIAKNEAAKSEAAKVDAQKSAVPNTGDSTNVIMPVAAGIASMLGITALRRKSAKEVK